MSRMPISEEGFKRIAGAAARSARKRTTMESELGGRDRLRFASTAEALTEFDRREDGRLVHKQNHKVWEMRAMPGGTVELYRIAEEPTDEDEREADADEEKPWEDDGEDKFARLLSRPDLKRAAARGAQFVPKSPIEEAPEEIDAQKQPQPGPAQPEVVAQDMQPAVTPGPVMPTASLKDVAERRDEPRLAGVVRGSKVLVRVADEVMHGKVLARHADGFDILLGNGATARIATKDVALERRAQPTQNPEPKARKVAVDEKAKEYYSKYWQEYGRQLTRSDLPRAITDHADPATPEGKQKTPTKQSSYKPGDVVDVGNIWMAPGSKLRTGVVRILALVGKKGSEGPSRVAVRDPFGNTGSVPPAAIVGTLPKEAFSRVRSGGTAGNRAAWLQAASAALSWGQIAARYPKIASKLDEIRAWVASGVEIGLAGGDVLTRSGAEYQNRYVALRKAGKSPADARKLAMNDCPGCWGKAAGMVAEPWFSDPLARGLDKKALDERGKEYYVAYFGPYGEDLVKEIRRRIKADFTERAAGARKAQEATQPVKPIPTPSKAQALPTPSTPPPPGPEDGNGEPVGATVISLKKRLARILSEHITGVIRRSGSATRPYLVSPRTVDVTIDVRRGTKRTIGGTFVGSYADGRKVARAKRVFEISLLAGKVKGIKIN